MGKKKPITVGNRHFDKQGDARDFYSGILWKYNVGDSLDVNDSIDLAALFKLHRDFDKKSGPGVKAFIVMISDEGSRCFGVDRLDGAKVGFSYKRCIDQRWN